MKLISTLMLLLTSAVFTLASDVEEWKQLEREVTFKAFSLQHIDSLKKAHGVLVDARKERVECKLPTYDKAVYHLKWGIINVGFGILENERDANGGLHNYGKAMTSGLVAHFLKVRDFIWSYGDAGSLHPYFFQESMYEKGLEDKPYIREKWTLYNNIKEQCFRWNGKKMEEKKISAFTNNYLSLLYNLRNSELTVGDTISYPCFVHGKNYAIKTAVLKREKITVSAGEFDCFKLQPILVGEGHGFNKNDKMFLWVEAKSPHLLIFAKADARLGKVRARLIHYEHYDD